MLGQRKTYSKPSLREEPSQIEIAINHEFDSFDREEVKSEPIKDITLEECTEDVVDDSTENE